MRKKVIGRDKLRGKNGQRKNLQSDSLDQKGELRIATRWKMCEGEMEERKKKKEKKEMMKKK